MNVNTGVARYIPRFGWNRRLKLVMQTERAECGLACVAMIASYYGHDVGLTQLRQKYPISARGASLKTIVSISDKLGLRARALRVQLEELEKIQTPSIIHLSNNHFVVLKRVNRRTVELHDPALGHRRLSISKLSDIFSGVVVELVPGHSFTATKERTPLRIQELLGKVRGTKRGLIYTAILALVLELTSLLSPLYVQTVIDQVLPNSDLTLLALLASGYLSLVVFQMLVAGVRAWAIVSFGSRLKLAWSSNVFYRLLKLSDAYFQNRHLGDIVSRFASVGAIQQVFTVRSVEVALDGTFALVTVVVLFLYSPALAGLVILGMVLYLVCKLVSYRMMKDANVDVITAAAKQDSYFLESIRAIATIRANNRRTSQHSGYVGQSINVLNKTIVLQSLDIFFAGIGTLIFGALKIGIVWLGARAAISGELSAGMLIAFIAYSDQFVGRASKLVDFVIELRLLRIQLERVADIMTQPPEPLLEGSFSGDLSDYSLSCGNVSFRYGEHEPWILRNVNLDINSGESIAIIGPSGCGKTTLLKILASSLDPTYGVVSVGGLELKTIGKERYRDVVSIVMQDDVLLAGTLADNISFFADDVSQEDIETAAKIAGIHSDIMAFPMRYETLVGDLGSTLSGGQKQRVCLARAIFRRPRILLLDEATSHLDLPLEKTVLNAISQLSITRVHVAHRPETVESVNRVFLLTHEGLKEVAKVDERSAAS